MLQRVRSGLAGQSFAQLVQISIQLFSVPLFIHAWGSGLYSEWVVVTAVPAYLALTDMGITGTAARDMAMHVARGDRVTALRVFQSTWLLTLLLTAIVVIAALLAIGFLSLSDIMRLSLLGRRDTGALLAIFSMYVLCNIQTEVVYAGFFCEGAYGFGLGLISAIRLVEFLAAMIIVASGGSPVATAIGYLLCRATLTLVMGLLLRQRFPWIRLGFSHASLAELRRLSGPAIASMAFPLGNAFSIQGMVLAVGFALGPTAAASFSTIRTLARIPVSLLNSAGRLVQPELSIAYGRNDLSLFREVNRRACQLTLWISLFSSAVLLVSGPFLYRHWTLKQLPMNYELFSLLLLAGLTNSLWYTALNVLYATNRHPKAALYYVVIYAAAFVAGYAACLQVGLYGVGLVLLAAEVILSVLVLPSTLSLTGDSWKAFVRELLTPPLYLHRVLLGR
jgi:O-antigen/teichoic acid export membrane protein